MSSPVSWMEIAVGGALGSVARFWLAQLAASFSRRLPWGTIVINGLGSFVIAFFGFSTGAGSPLQASESTRLFVMVGLCGGFTTFSSFSLQTLDLLRQGAPVRAGVNVAGSVLICLAAIVLGFEAALALWGGPG